MSNSIAPNAALLPSGWETEPCLPMKVQKLNWITKADFSESAHLAATTCYPFGPGCRLAEWNVEEQAASVHLRGERFGAARKV
jgi:hypothetical protein